MNPYTPTNLKGKFVILGINQPNKQLKTILLGFYKAKMGFGFPLTGLHRNILPCSVTFFGKGH